MIRLENIISTKIDDVFHGLIKLNSEDLVGSTTLARKTLLSLSQYSVCACDRENEYSIGLNVSQTLFKPCIRLVSSLVLSRDMKSRGISLREMSFDLSHTPREIYLYRFS